MSADTRQQQIEIVEKRSLGVKVKRMLMATFAALSMLSRVASAEETQWFIMTPGTLSQSAPNCVPSGQLYPGITSPDDLIALSRRAGLTIQTKLHVVHIVRSNITTERVIGETITAVGKAGSITFVKGDEGCNALSAQVADGTLRLSLPFSFRPATPPTNDSTVLKPKAAVMIIRPGVSDLGHTTVEQAMNCLRMEKYPTDSRVPRDVSLTHGEGAAYYIDTYINGRGVRAELQITEGVALLTSVRVGEVEVARNFSEKLVALETLWGDCWNRR